MFTIPYEKIVQTIKEKSGLSEKEIESKIKEKIDSLSGLVSREGAAHIIANELGIQLIEKFSGKLDIQNIVDGMRKVEVSGKVVRKFDVREFGKKDGTSGKVGALILSDETGTVRVVFWNDLVELFEKIKEGDVLRVKNAYARLNKVSGGIELQISDTSSVELNPEGVEVEVEVFAEAERKKIAELSDSDNNVELLTTIVNVFDPRFFQTCPHCNKKARTTDEGKYVCDQHGEVEPNHRAVMNLILDDGTDTIRSVFFNNQIKALIEKEDDFMDSARKDLSVLEPVKKDLLGKIIRIIGRVNKNELFDRKEFVVNRVYPNPDPEEEAKKL
ncbi:MAG TPA: DUF2240 family protein [Candidatus Woesearchaeota archaeon]|nr:DUF2240 family protein [Candidatus Woesearchaeota archaeon]